MDFGIAWFCTDEGPDPASFGRMVEERGFESVFLPEHTHIPAARETPYPAGADLPREYPRILDPFVTLAAIAGATERLRLATGICLIVERDPITTAKEVATLDRISGGRVLFGVGAGWNEEEMRNHGTDPRRRFGIMRERVEAMKAIWTEDEASYSGRYVEFERIWSWPKPAQKPHPPILVGGNGRTVYERVLAYGDEWYPNRFGDEERFFPRIQKLMRLADEAGRRRPGVTLALAPLEAAGIERYEAAGVNRCVWYVPPRGDEAIERALDRYQQAMTEYRGE